MSVLENVMVAPDGLVFSSNYNIDNANYKNIDTKIYHKMNILCMINFNATIFPESCPQWLINPDVEINHQTWLKFTLAWNVTMVTKVIEFKHQWLQVLSQAHSI